MLTDGPASRSADRPRCLELVGLAGVGKSHLMKRLSEHYGARQVDLARQRVTASDAGALGSALMRMAPLYGYIARSNGFGTRDSWVTSRQFTYFAWQEEVAMRTAPPPELLLAEEGWFHKLRRLRRLLGTDVTFSELPEGIRRRLFRADAVVIMTADPMEICARKLRRRGRDVTDSSLAQQYAQSAALGQWEELDLTRQDVRQAAEMHGLAYVEIDYRHGYDVETELLPALRGIGFG